MPVCGCKSQSPKRLTPTPQELPGPGCFISAGAERGSPRFRFHLEDLAVQPFRHAPSSQRQSRSVMWARDDIQLLFTRGSLGDAAPRLQRGPPGQHRAAWSATRALHRRCEGRAGRSSAAGSGCLPPVYGLLGTLEKSQPPPPEEPGALCTPAGPPSLLLLVAQLQLLPAGTHGWPPLTVWRRSAAPGCEAVPQGSWLPLLGVGCRLPAGAGGAPASPAR